MKYKIRSLILLLCMSCAVGFKAKYDFDSFEAGVYFTVDYYETYGEYPSMGMREDVFRSGSLDFNKRFCDSLKNRIYPISYKAFLIEIGHADKYSKTPQGFDSFLKYEK